MGRIMVVFVHTIEGRPVVYHVGKDKISATKKGPVVLVRANGERVKLRESKKEIEAFIREM
jgi:hypothetical protein